MADSSRGQKVESSKWTRLDGKIPEDKIVTHIDTRPHYFNKESGMTEEDLEGVIQKEASGCFNAYILYKAPEPHAFGMDEMYSVIYLQLEKAPPDCTERLNDVYNKLAAEAKKLEGTAEEYIKVGGIRIAMDILRKAFSDELCKAGVS